MSTNPDPEIRGQAAKALLDSELLSEVFEALDAAYVLEWRNAETTDEREAAHTRISLLSEVRKELEQMALTGELVRERDS